MGRLQKSWAFLVLGGILILAAGIGVYCSIVHPKGFPALPEPELSAVHEDLRALLLDRPVSRLPVVDDYGWNRWASESTAGAILTWWLAVTALGWLAWPLAFTMCRGLRDRGYLLSRSVALLIIGYLVWLPASLHWLQNGLPLTYAAIGVLTLASGVLLWRKRGEMAAFVQHRWGVLVFEEALFGLAFLLFVGIRILNPDLWQPWRGGEKPMDMAYLNACLRSAFFPPYDPYFSDGYLNYYYYGAFLVSILTRLTGIRSVVAFNLAVPTLFALTVGNAFSVGYSLDRGVLAGSSDGDEQTRRGIGRGLLAALFVAVLGNLASATQLVEHLAGVSESDFTSPIPALEALVRAVSGIGQVLLHGARLPSFNYWDPSRVIGPTINEFPYWSFLFADLHPHLVNLPFTLLVVALALNWVRQAPANGQAFSLGLRRDGSQVLEWILYPLVLGALAAINTWDWPAYAGFCGLVLLFVRVRAHGWRGILLSLSTAATLCAASLLLYVPFSRSYKPIYVGLGWGLARGETRLDEFLTVWGFYLFLAITLLGVVLATRRSRWAILRLMRLIIRYNRRLARLDELYGLLVREVRTSCRLSIWGVAATVVAAFLLAWQGHWVLSLMLPWLFLAAALMIQARAPDERQFVLALVFTAFLLLVGVELFYLKDHLDGGDAWRMNTVFKFHMQVWIMLGIALGVSLPDIWRATERWRGAWRQAWTLVFGLLLFSATLFLVLGTPARVADRFPGARPAVGTLDGLSFMTVGRYNWPDESNPIELWGDYQAIRWLEENVRGTPVLAEAPAWYYRDFGGRVASYTGLPTPYNDTHEREQRYNVQFGPRSDLVREFFMTGDVQRTLELIRELGIRYVYLGPLERTYIYVGLGQDPDAYWQATSKFEQLVSEGRLAVVYRNELVTIYRVL